MTSIWMPGTYGAAVAADYSLGSFPDASTWDNDLDNTGTSNTLSQWGNSGVSNSVQAHKHTSEVDFAVDYSFSRIVMRTSEFNEDGPDSPTTHYIDIGEDWVAADHFEFRWEMDTTSTAAHPGTDPATDYGVTETATNPFLDPNDNNGFAEDTWHTMSESTASPSLLQWTVEDNTSGGADACKAIFGLVLKIRGVNSGTYYPDSNGITTGTVHCWMRTAYTASGMMG